MNMNDNLLSALTGRKPGQEAEQDGSMGFTGIPNMMGMLGQAFQNKFPQFGQWGQQIQNKFPQFQLPAGGSPQGGLPPGATNLTPMQPPTGQVPPMQPPGHGPLTPFQPQPQPQGGLPPGATNLTPMQPPTGPSPNVRGPMTQMR